MYAMGEYVCVCVGVCSFGELARGGERKLKNLKIIDFEILFLWYTLINQTIKIFNLCFKLSLCFYKPGNIHETQEIFSKAQCLNIIIFTQIREN